MDIKIYEKEQIDRIAAAKANTADFALAGGVPRAGYVSSLFSSGNTSLMTTINGVVGTPNAALEAILGTAS